MMKPIHILNETGVLASFSVAKKITEEDIQKYFSKQKKSGKTVHQINNMLQDQISKDIQDAILNNKIPGLISSQELVKQLALDQTIVDKMPELNRLVMIITHKLAEKKYDKMSLCYFINSLVNLLNLTERDFENFHQQSGNDLDDEDSGEFSDEE